MKDRVGGGRQPKLTVLGPHAIACLPFQAPAAWPVRSAEASASACEGRALAKALGSRRLRGAAGAAGAVRGGRRAVAMAAPKTKVETLLFDLDG